MSEVVIKTRENGPLLVTGPIKLTDHLGNVYDLSGKENVALCRCGAIVATPVLRRHASHLRLDPRRTLRPRSAGSAQCFCP